MSTWLKKLWYEEARNYIYSELRPDQIPDDYRVTNASIAANSVYLSIFLHSLSIPYSRRGTGKYFGAVHSFISIPHISRQNAQFNMFIAPDNLRNFDQSHLDRVVTGGRRLLDPIPYRGGDIEIELGLFSIKSSDLAGPFLNVLQNMAMVAGVSFISTAMPFVKPILEGVNELTGAGAAVLEIGRTDTLHTPKVGYFVVMQAEKDMIDISKLKLGQDGKLYDSSGTVKYPYIVFNIEASDKRDDWFKIPEIQTAHKKIIDAVRDHDINKADSAFKSFELITITSGDLLHHHATKLIAEVQGELQSVLPAMTTSAKPELGIRKQDEIDLYA